VATGTTITPDQYTDQYGDTYGAAIPVVTGGGTVTAPVATATSATGTPIIRDGTIPDRDITLTATLVASNWSAATIDSNWAGELLGTNWSATLES
jgi:D-serine deaminase-like pyridoxal phosphate-dependent protein